MTEFSFVQTTSPWGADAPETIEYEYTGLYYTIPTSAGSWGPDGAELDLLLFRGGLDIDFTASFGASIGLIAKVVLDPGSVDVTYDIELNEVVSNVLNTINQKSFIDTANWSVIGASVELTGTDPSNSEAVLSLGFQANASLDMELHAYIDGHTIVDGWHNIETFDDSFNVFGFNIPLQTKELAWFRPSEGSVEFDSGGFGDVTVTLPNTPGMETSDLIADSDGYGNLSVSDVGDSFITVDLGISKILAATLGVPALSGSWPEETPFPLDFGIDWTLLDAHLEASLSLKQKLELVPGDVDVEMTSSFAPTYNSQGNLLTLGETVTSKLGDKFEFATPEGEGSFTVTAKYTLDAVLKNTLIINGSIDFRMLAVGGGFHMFVDFGVGEAFGIDVPSHYLYDETIPIVSGDLYTFPTISQALKLPLSQTTYTVFYENFYLGTEGADTFTLTTHQVEANGKGGNDVITGNILDNHILGGAGLDKLYGMGGDDSLDGGSGADILDGGAGSDTASYASSTAGVLVDLMGIHRNTGDALNDTYISIENLEGSAFADVLWGSDGANLISGGAGNDTLHGRSGDDTLVGGLGADQLYGEAGADRFLYNTLAEKGDTITGYSTGDHVVINRAGFGLGIDADFAHGVGFFSGKAPVAAGSGPAFLYNTKTGGLWFDDDGAGAHAAILLVTIIGSPLTTADILFA